MENKTKNKKRSRKILKGFSLPSGFCRLETIIVNKKKELMIRVLDSIEFAINNGLTSVDVFEFDKTNYVVSLDESKFSENLNNIMSYCIENEYFEECNRIKKINDQVEK